MQGEAGPMKKAFVRVDAAKTLHTISPYLHGHFIEHLGKCIYNGIWVGPDSDVENEAGLRSYVIAALKDLGIPVLRWPGGCFADQYHWREGIGPPGERPSRRNIHWRQNESNAFGTEEFMDLCRRLGSEPYIAANAGSGTVQEAADWVEYCNSEQPTHLAKMREANGSPAPHNVRFWGIGNEPWGCGGNMAPESYADLFARYATYLRAADPAVKLVLGGSHHDLEWDHRVLTHLGRRVGLADYLAVHSYSGKGLSDRDGSPAKLLRLWRDLLTKERFLRQTLGLLESQCGEESQIGLVLDEWGTWYDEAQIDNGLAMANTLADALFAASSLHLFHSLGARLIMANLAQTVNVLQCLVHTEGGSASKTPTYHAFHLLKPHQGAQRVFFEVDGPRIGLTVGEIDQVSASASRAEGGRAFVSLVNRSPFESLEVEVQDVSGATVDMTGVRVLSAQSLASENFPNRPSQVSPRTLEEDRPMATLEMPAASMMVAYINEP